MIIFCFCIERQVVYEENVAESLDVYEKNIIGYALL